MFGDPFYHNSIRNMVAVFGTIFNNISVVKRGSVIVAIVYDD